MKKTRAILCLLSFVVVICMGCTFPENSHGNEGSMEEDVFINEGSTEPTNRLFCNFDTYEEFEDWISIDENGSAPAMEEIELHGEFYKEFVEKLLREEAPIVKPYWGENLLEFRNEDGFPNIEIMCWDGYRPYVWYFCKVGDTECRFEILYMSKDEIAYSQNHSIEEVHKYIHPNSQGLDEWQDGTIYKNMFVENITLQDRAVSVLSQERCDDIRLYKYFVYDDWYVTMVVYEDSFNNANWQEFSLRTE